MTAYEEACEAMNEATRRFNLVRDAYRAGTVGDDEFLAARKRWDAAMAVYDAAYIAERDKGE